MDRKALVVVAALASALALGCGRAATAAPVTPEHEAPPAFTADQEVPLLAPDEAAPSAASTRLTTTKTIGGGADDTSVDRGRVHDGGGPVAIGGAPGVRPTALRTRGYVRSTGTGVTRPTYAAPSGTGLPVGGSFPAAPSFGPPAAR